MICGLLGRKLGHSYSPSIHRQLGYDYVLVEKEPEELETYLKEGAFTGLNVTMPYKKAVIPYLDAITETAKKLGAVNTIVRRADGSLLGHNTDYFGFSYMLKQSGIPVSGKTALVLGSGGACATVCAVLRELGARVTVISRRGEHNYNNLDLGASLIVNTTPVGMYPDTGISPVDLSRFSRLEAVLDVVYNPTRTALLLQAEALGIPHLGGLSMLVAQAWESAKWFTGRALAEEDIRRVLTVLEQETQNIILIGMPGCGKSTAGEALAKELGRKFMDVDRYIEAKSGMSIPEIFQIHGQTYFRNLETDALADLCKQSGLVIACGGGVVTQSRNYPLLHQNGKILWLQRDLAKLPTQGRPLSQQTSPEEMYAQRFPLYEHFADRTVDNNGNLRDTVKNIREACL